MELKELEALLDKVQGEVADLMEGASYQDWDKDEKWQFMLQLEEQLGDMPWAIELPFEPGFSEKGFPESIKTTKDMASHLLNMLQESKRKAKRAED